MKKLILILVALVGMYYARVYFIAHLSDRNAEKVMAQMLPDISSPWSAKKIRSYGSDWRNRRSPLTPEEIANSAEADLGSFLEFVEKPDCNFQAGYERPSNIKVILAVCELTARFEKADAWLKIRLVEEPTPPPSFFVVLGNSLKLDDIADISIIKKREKR
jgi:hypothetical protein